MHRAAAGGRLVGRSWAGARQGRRAVPEPGGAAPARAEGPAGPGEGRRTTLRVPAWETLLHPADEEGFGAGGGAADGDLGEHPGGLGPEGSVEKGVGLVVCPPSRLRKYYKKHDNIELQ